MASLVKSVRRPRRADRAAHPVWVMLAASVAAGVLLVVGWSIARALDSALLGFVFADILFLIAVALRSAVTAPRQSY